MSWGQGSEPPGSQPLAEACTIIDRLDISEIEAGYKGGSTSSYNLRKYIALGAPGRSVAVGRLPLRGVSTPGHGQGEGPVGSKLSRSDDADDDGRGRSERSERSPLRGKLPPLRSLAHKKRGRPFLVDPFYSNDAGSYSAAGASSAFGASAFLARLRRVAFFSALGADARAASLKSTNSMRAISEASP